MFFIHYLVWSLYCLTNKGSLEDDLIKCANEAISTLKTTPWITTIFPKFCSLWLQRHPSSFSARNEVAARHAGTSFHLFWNTACLQSWDWMMMSFAMERHVSWETRSAKGSHSITMSSLNRLSKYLASCTDLEVTPLANSMVLYISILHLHKWWESNGELSLKVLFCVTSTSALTTMAKLTTITTRKTTSLFICFYWLESSKEQETFYLFSPILKWKWKQNRFENVWKCVKNYQNNLLEYSSENVP